MTKQEFLNKLYQLLSPLSDEERMQAMKYYEDYFADAGEENESTVLKELGSPEEIAKELLSDVSNTSTAKDAIQYGNNITSDNQINLPSNQTFQGQQYQQQTTPPPNQSAYQKQYKKDRNIIPIVILAVILCPVWIPVAASIFGIGIGAICLIIGLLVGFFCTGFGLTVGGIFSVIYGVILLFTSTIAKAIFTIGVGFLLMAFGILICYLGVLFCIHFFPACIRGCVRLGKKILNLFH